MILHAEDIKNLEQRYRTTFINSLAGLKQVVLIGSASREGVGNLAIFNSIIHIGANPAYYGFICRPDTVKRDTLQNIMDTQWYTFNYVRGNDFVKAHQTSAKYTSAISEFDAVGFTREDKTDCIAPFVKEAVVKIALQLEDKVDIKINNTTLVIGSIKYVETDEGLVGDDGFVALDRANILACAGLDAYYTSEFLGRLTYARPDRWPSVID